MLFIFWMFSVSIAAFSCNARVMLHIANEQIRYINRMWQVDQIDTTHASCLYSFHSFVMYRIFHASMVDLKELNAVLCKKNRSTILWTSVECHSCICNAIAFWNTIIRKFIRFTSEWLLDFQSKQSTLFSNIYFNKNPDEVRPALAFGSTKHERLLLFAWSLFKPKQNRIRNFRVNIYGWKEGGKKPMDL